MPVDGYSITVVSNSTDNEVRQLPHFVFIYDMTIQCHLTSVCNDEQINCYLKVLKPNCSLDDEFERSFRLDASIIAFCTLHVAMCSQQEIDISKECTPLGGRAGLRCTLRLPHGCYRLRLLQWAPWFDNSYYADHCRHMHHDFCT